jgi:hypothetical protein
MADEVNSNPDMPYDLRQIYAVQIIGTTLQKIEFAREQGNMVLLFDLLTMHLHTNLNQKLTEKEREEYNIIEQNTIKELNKNGQAFIGTDKTPEKIARVKIVLKKLEMWLKDKMQTHGLFGSGWSDDDGL